MTRSTGPAMRLELAGIRVEHPRAARAAALDGVTLRIEPGERVALVGPSGAGKTTLLSVMGAALRPTAGTVALDGADPWRLSSSALRRLRGRLFLVPQAPPLPPRQRVVTAVLAGRLPGMGLGAALASLVRPADPQAAHDALACFGLPHKLWSRVDRLSGGERQRVSLARALVSDARVLLCDEPLSALDPTLARDALRALREAAAARGATLVCSLHQIELALSGFERVVGLRDGRVLFDRAPALITPAELDRLYAGRRGGASGAEAGTSAGADDRGATGVDDASAAAGTRGDASWHGAPAPLPEAVEAMAEAPLPHSRCG